jgi:hypothetical protein
VRGGRRLLGSGADDADAVGQGVASGDVVGLGDVDAGQRWCGGEGCQVGVLVAQGEERQEGEVGEGCQVGVVADLEEPEVGEVGQGVSGVRSWILGRPVTARRVRRVRWRRGSRSVR